MSPRETEPARLLYVNHTLSFSQGGAEVVLLELFRRMDPQRFDCHLAAPRDREGVPTEFSSLNTQIHLLPTAEQPALKNPLRYLQFAFRLIRLILSCYLLLRRLKPDIVHINSIVSLVLGHGNAE